MSLMHATNIAHLILLIRTYVTFPAFSILLETGSWPFLRVLNLRW